MIIPCALLAWSLTSMDAPVTPLQCKVFVPNVFTPNGDGVNDEFRPEFGCSIDQYHLRVFNRWGILVFESKDPSTGWEGAYRGKPLPRDVYAYWCTFQDAADEGGNVQQLTGDVLLLR